MITYKEIAKTVEAFNLVPFLLTEYEKINGEFEKKVFAIQFYFPSMAKDSGIDFFNSVFRNDGLSIQYISCDEMIQIKIPDANNLIHPASLNHPYVKNKKK